MVKLKCEVCGKSGYTAAQEKSNCECGGQLHIVPEWVVADEDIDLDDRVRAYLEAKASKVTQIKNLA